MRSRCRRSQLVVLRIAAVLTLSTITVILALPSPLAAGPVLLEGGPHYLYNGLPFSQNCGNTRYQQIYSSSLFSGPVDILSLAFSPDSSGLYSAVVDIRLTTTSVAVDGISSNLDSNFVTPLTTVFSNTAFTQVVTGGPETFSLVFDFASTPFFYNPASGNLLLDILISDQTPYMFFSRSEGSGVFSRAYDSEVRGNNTDLVGLRTLMQAETAAVPDPGSTLLLFGMGLAGLRVWRKR